MHTQGAVDARAVDAQEHAIWDTRPAGVFSGTIKTYLHTNRASISCNNFNEISVANIKVLITLFCSITTTMTCDIFSIIYTVNAYHDFRKPKDTNSNTRFNNKDRRGQVKRQVGLVNAGTFMKSLLQQLLQWKAAGTPVLNWIKRIPWLCAIYVWLCTFQFRNHCSRL